MITQAEPGHDPAVVVDEAGSEESCDPPRPHPTGTSPGGRLDVSGVVPA